MADLKQVTPSIHLIKQRVSICTLGSKSNHNTNTGRIFGIRIVLLAIRINIAIATNMKCAKESGEPWVTLFFFETRTFGDKTQPI